MAITGSGTAASPYIVTTADELKDAMETHHSTGDYLYVELGNTIDLNFSGAFEKIQTSDSYDHIDLNLAGYAIQNVFLTDAMFELQKADVIHDGKILNILTAPAFDAEHFFSKGFFRKISTSTFADVPTNSIFNGSKFEADALSLRYKIAQPQEGDVFKSIILRGADSSDEYKQINESHIKIVVDEWKAADSNLIAPPESGLMNITNSLIEGEITLFNNADAEYYPRLSTVQLITSAVNYSVPTYSGSAASVGASRNFCKGHTSYKSIVNTEVISSAYTSPIDSGCIAVTSNDWTNATRLTGMGFEAYSAGTR